jgi:citrate lyase subunit beta/citryl-CoA lyase
MLMRSKLFVPATRPELFAKAEGSAADSLSFDLEDAVTEERKDEARETLSRHLRAREASGKLIVVRINGALTRHFEADAAAMAVADVVNLPMVDDADQVRLLASRLAQHEATSNRTKILVNIETPRALRIAAMLASAHARVIGLQIGYADLLEPFGIARRDEGALAHIRVAVRLAAAEAGVAAYDGAFGAVNDPEGYRAECVAARRQGFAGKTCIHPSQIAIANETFRPSEAEVLRARRIVAAAAAAEADGVGAVLVDGQMIDRPFVEGARAVLAWAQSAAG